LEVLDAHPSRTRRRARAVLSHFCRFPKAFVDQAGIKVHMIFAEELMERMAAEERKPELVRDA
jgi:hypothetical protein